MNRKKANLLDLGPDVVKLLLPHRRPFLMVDRIVSFSRAPRPNLTASRHISANEEVFAGHFPHLSLWPGVYTIEGLAQSSNLLGILTHLQALWEERGNEPEEPLEILRNLELAYRLKPGFRAEVAAPMMAVLKEPSVRMGVVAAIDIKLLHPVFAGQRLDYLVAMTHAIGDMVRFEVDAQVDGRPVARGTLTSKSRAAFPALLPSG